MCSRDEGFPLVIEGFLLVRCVVLESVAGTGSASPVPPDFRVGAPALHVAQRAIRPAPATHAFGLSWLKANPAFG